MQKKHPFIIVVHVCLLLFLTTGCGVMQYIKDRFITIQQVVDHSLRKMEKPSGVRTIIKGKEIQTLLRDGQISRLDSKLYVKQLFKNYPNSFHAVNQYTTGGNPFRSETYLINGTIYQQNGTSGWQKQKGKLHQLKLLYDPIHIMGSLKQVIHKKGVQMKLVGNDFVLTVNRHAAKKILAPFYKNFMSSYQQLGIENQQEEEKSIQVEKFSHQLYIDKTSMQLRKIESTITLKTAIEGGEFTTEYISTIDLFNGSKGAMSVPENVITNAIGFNEQKFAPSKNR